MDAVEKDEREARHSQQLQFRLEVFQSAAMVVTADGVISEREIDTLLDLGNRLLPTGIDREQLGSVCSSIRLNRITPQNYIATVSRSWSPEQRRVALQVVFLAASSEGQILPAQLSLLSWMRSQFAMSEREYESAIEEAIEREADVVPQD